MPLGSLSDIDCCRTSKNHPASLSNLFSLVMGNFIGRGCSRPNQTRIAKNTSPNLKTVVYNKSDLLLIIKDYYIYMKEGMGYYGGEKFEFRAGERKKIPSGNFIREYVANRVYQEIHVMSGEHVLLTLSDDDFHENEGRVLQLVWDLLHNCLSYDFVDPTQDINN